MRFEIDVKVPSLNEYIKVCNRNHYESGRFKKDKQAEIAVFLARMPRYTKPLRLHFTWIEADRRRDLDNVCGGGRKLILDTMVALGKIPNDSYRYIRGFSDTFEYGKKAKVILDIEEIDER